MPLMSRLTSLWRNIFHKARTEEELTEELDAYLELLTEQKISAGLAPEAARRSALLELGGKQQVKEKVREVSAGHFLETLGQDLRYTLRTLRRNPGFAAVAVLTLALGIGANTTIFMLVNAVFLQPLPVAEPARLMSVFGTDENNRGAQHDFIPMSWPNFKDYRDQNDVFTGMIAFQNTVLNFSGGGESERIDGMIVTGNYFDLLGVKAAIGRTFLPEEDRTPGTYRVPSVKQRRNWKKSCWVEKNVFH